MEGVLEDEEREGKLGESMAERGDSRKMGEEQREGEDEGRRMEGRATQGRRRGENGD